ncbi:MAG: peptidoglycan-binding domain-containing protein [Candidatus Paceibacterota bacterium]
MLKIKSNSVKFFAAVLLVLGMSSVAHAAVTFSSPIDTAQERMDVQTVLNMAGANPVLTVDGKFGPMTNAAVKAFQAKNGLVADAIIGMKTRAALNAAQGTSTTGGSSTVPGCTSTVGFSPTTGMSCATTTVGSSGLNGTAGSIATMTQLSQYSSEEIGAGQTDIKVLGTEVKASNDGDIALTSMKLVFDSSANASGDSDRLTDYISSVSVWMGSTKVATVSASDFNKEDTGIYKKVVTLSNAVVRADKTEKFYVSVDAISNLDSGDIDSDSWSVAIENVRVLDGSGVVTTETSAIPAAIDYDNAGDGVAMLFVSYSSAADTEVQFSIDSASPKETIVTVDTTNTTDNVVLAKGKIKVKGTSDIWLDEVPFLFTTDATNVDAVAPTVMLTISGTEFSETMTASAGTTEVITFNDLDLTLKAGTTVDFTISADIEDIETSTFDEGDKLKVELDSTRRASIVAENSQGDSLADGTELTGTSLGEYMHFYSTAPAVEVVSASIVANDNGSSAAASATAKMKVKITAQGGDVYINGDDITTASYEFFTFAKDGGDASTSVGSATYATTGTYTTTTDSSGNEYFTIAEGNSMYVEATLLVTQATGSSPILVGAKATALLFGTASTSEVTRSANSMNWTTLTDLMKTGKVTLDS